MSSSAPITSRDAEADDLAEKLSRLGLGRDTDPPLYYNLNKPASRWESWEGIGRVWVDHQYVEGSCALYSPYARDRDLDADEPHFLACPYLKYDPKTYGQRKGCRGASFISIHRLKEVKTHLKSRTPCEATESPGIEGFDASQEKRLKSKKKVHGVTTEEDKWKEIFKILFPDRTEIPSLFYDFSFSNDASNKVSLRVRPNGFDGLGRRESSSTERHQQTDDIESILTRDVPPDLDEEAFSQMDEAVGGQLSRGKKRKLLDVVKGLAVKMFKRRIKDEGRGQGKGLPSTSQQNGIHGLATEHDEPRGPTVNHASAQVYEEVSSSSALANVQSPVESKQSPEEEHPAATQAVSEPNQPEIDSHSIPAQDLDFSDLYFGNFDYDAEPDINTLFAAYEDQTTWDWNYAVVPLTDAPGDGSEAVNEGEVTAIVRQVP
ncbi:hypothetical protein CSOJ01_05218 [Colletotrichum sojae]|uniref:Uncharacterized protein n=1 Tax=Colletotrichum sojae TaxID=2175907 RepID=A0A8H6JG65_9PEZI|nr:hypothetical protein CSOJ01_05218 [Colletotrichum sojae]